MSGPVKSLGLDQRIASAVNFAVDFASLSMNWPRWLKRASVALLDAGLCIAAVWLAFSLRLGELYPPDPAMALFAAAMLGAWFPIAALRGVYAAIFRFA